MASKAAGPSGSGSNRSGPVVIGAVTTVWGGATAAIAGDGVRPGAQEAASSARRRRGNRRQRAGPYTPPCYYEIVYLSRQAQHAVSGGRSWRYNSAALPTMHFFLGLVELVLALLVMLGILLQTPKASGLCGTIGGGGDSGGGYRTKRGLEKNLFYTTIGLVVLFVVISVVYIRLPA